MELTDKDAAIAFAKAWNQLDCSEFLKLLDDDAHYASQWVFSELENKAAISEYLVGKMKTVKNTDSKVYAELIHMQKGNTTINGVFLTQEEEGREAVVLFKVKNNRISRYDLCMPHLFRFERTGVYPN